MAKTAEDAASFNVGETSSSNLASAPLNGNEEETVQRVIDSATSAKYWKEFFVLAVTFSVNHATVTTPLQFSSSVLTNAAGQGSNAVLYGVCLVCSLFFANLLFSILGPKRGLAVSMVAYSVYVIFFAFAASECAIRDPDKGTCTEGGPAQMPVAIIGAAIGGFGAGLLWTCQGAFVTQVCEKLAIAENTNKDEITAKVMGYWGTIFLATEAMVRALTTVMIKYIKISFPGAFFFWAGCALIASILFVAIATDLRADSPAQAGSVSDKLLAAVKLWNDPKLWLLQCTNIAFGFAVAWLSGYVAKNIFSVAISASFIGFAGAILSGFAAVLSQVFGKVAAKVGKGPVVGCGALAFLALGICSKWLGPEDPADWQWGALIFYVFMGIGRAVYESTNKAIFADFFPHPKSAGAFANVFVFNSGSSCIAFILGATGTEEPELYFLLAFAGLTIPGFVIATLLKRKAESE
jgi:MFS family permease